mmetsp:Transcript_49499/g.112439  ORF Transcript_49499/g.112439 Transcript_49499/m.112439 type:complete len:128 (+) Transcript_49499:43-426(+)|eukprot:CAMPEP_0204337190 /NCGR_PEP_ID=MMETSP0469-20131031/20125_1 /ASSEMBLY_ACC=CAM_ASM_000384 /TAXON_ID=2969 /ORGANISM="Oxyrrhis marina" /LENGTH=127 /DNA_ID=CAMNT_0051321183 /DNA_START=31 /DNA_END=414 /DNA_ORIENTATION=+
MSCPARSELRPISAACPLPAWSLDDPSDCVVELEGLQGLGDLDLSALPPLDLGMSAEEEWAMMGPADNRDTLYDAERAPGPILFACLAANSTMHRSSSIQSVSTTHESPVLGPSAPKHEIIEAGMLA